MKGKHFDIRSTPDTTTGNHIASEKSMFDEKKWESGRKVRMSGRKKGVLKLEHFHLEVNKQNTMN